MLDIAFVTTPYYGTVSSYKTLTAMEFTTDAAINEDNITSERDEDIFANFTFEDEVEKDDVIAVTIDVLSGEYEVQCRSGRADRRQRYPRSLDRR